jgi:chromosome partitioning protein
MMISLANQKGGVGKSTIAVHLAVWLFDQGYKTALLDADKQRSSSQWLSQAEERVTVRVADTPDACVAEASDLATTHDFVVGDGPGGIDDVSRTMLLLSDLALLPISPSILDLRSVKQATAILRYAQQINGARPAGRLVLNKMRTRDTISRELIATAPTLGVSVVSVVLRDLQAYRDAAQQGTAVTRMGRKGAAASEEIKRLFTEVVGDTTRPITDKETGNG